MPARTEQLLHCVCRIAARVKIGLLLLLALGTLAQPARTEPAEEPLPAGTIARLGTLRLRAIGGEIGLSPDGKTIVAVIAGREVRSWDADAGTLRERRELPVPSFQNFHLSLDGRLLMGRESIEAPLDVWDVRAGKRLRRLQLPQRQGIYRAAFSPNGKKLAVATHRGIERLVHLWDMESGEHRELKGSATPPESLAFSPDGKFFAASDGRRILCWDTSTGEQLWRKKSAWGTCLAFTPDGRTLIGSPGSGERAWHAWDVAIGRPVQGLKLPQGYNYAELAIAPDGRTLVFVQHRNVDKADGRVRLWDLREGKLLHTLAGGGQIGPFFPDGKSFLTNDGIVQRWELASGRPLLPDSEALGHRGEIARVVYSPDGRLLASTARDGAIRLWNIATAKPRHILRGPEWDTMALSFTRDGQFLVSGGLEGDLFVWDTQNGKEVRRIALHDPKRGEKKQHVWRLHVTPDGGTVIVLGYDPGDGIGLNGILTTWDLATGRRKTVAANEPSDGLYSAFSPEGRLLASRGELIDTETGKARVKLEAASGAFGYYAFSPDGRRVAGLVTRQEITPTQSTTRMDGIQIWDAASGRALRRIVTDWVGQLAFTPDGRYLAAADLQGIRLWELASGQVVLRHKAHKQMRGSYGNSFASCLAFAPDGRSLATGHRDSLILIWDMTSSAAAAASLPRCWEDLADADAAGAYAASWRMTAASAETVPFLRKHLRPAAPASAEQMRALLADLDSDEFRRREAAAAKLHALDDRAASAMQAALEAKPSLEMRRRLETLLKALEKSPSRETLRDLRAVTVLERIGTPEAREFLKQLAQGDPAARLTREAKFSAERLAKRR